MAVLYQSIIVCASLHYLVNVFEATQLNYLQLSKDSYTHRIYSTKIQEQRLSDAVHSTETSYCYVTAQARRCKSKTYVQRCTKVDAFKGRQSRLQSYASPLNILCSILIEKTLF